MKQKKLIFNFFVNRNWKKLTDSRKRAKILADNRKRHHPIVTLLIGLACVAWSRNYLITGRAKEHAKGREGLLSFFLFPPPPPPPKKTTTTTTTNWRPLRRLWLALLWNVFARVKVRKEPSGEGSGAREIKVRSCYTGSSGSKMRKSRHLCKFQTMISSSMRKVHYGPLWHCG